MPFDPYSIAKEHILQGVQKINRENIELKPSKRWNVIISGKAYPALEVMRFAHEAMNNERIWEYREGKDTNKWLNKFGFQIVAKSDNDDPVLGLIKRYKTHLKESQLEDELYKWRLIKTFNGRPDTSANNFTTEITSIDFSNLIYPLGIGVVQQIAKERPEELRQAFLNLYREDIDLTQRVKNFSEECAAIYDGINQEKKFHHHQDERTIATYLAFHDSLRYPLYKDSFYRKYCNLIGVRPKKKGEKYAHYLSLIQDFINKYVIEDPELIDFKSTLLTNDCFDDSNHMIFAQDILYSTLDKQKGLSRSYWRIGTRDGDSSYWNTMRIKQYVSIGWPAIGDLSEEDIQERNDIIELFKKTGYYTAENMKGTASRKAGEVLNFLNEIKEGDIILAQNGANVLGIGEVIGDYGYDSSEEFAHYKPVNWKIMEPELKNFDGLQTTVYKIQEPSTIHKIENLLTISKNAIKTSNDLNQILYGPPGTGKTYNTINKALEICGENLHGLSRQNIKERYELKVKEGRIVFTTFHQSMTYEDFVEGIKPIEPEKEGDPVVYRIEEGIFRKLCIEAAFSLAKKEKSKKTVNVLDFSLAFDSLVEKIEERLATEQQVELITKNGGKVLVEGISQQGSILIKHPGKDNIYPVTKQRLSKLHAAFFDLSKVSNIDQQFRAIIGGSNSTANWAVLNAIRENNLTLDNSKATVREHTWEEKKEVVQSLSKDDYTDKDGEAFVLIIDEINRGNISQIFGELITLIEDDKRLGNTEAIQVELPYSKELFGVPPNLYIIGTMNTADRSIEALDTALRRRFCFVETPPKYDLIETVGKAPGGLINNINLSNLLQVINKRIEKLLDKDHMIGHSYFLNISTLADLKATFQKKIIPLLQEYFYGDFGRIGLVVGAGFFLENKNEVEEDFFAPFYDYDSSPLLEKRIYHLKNALEMDDDQFTSAINMLLGNS